VVKDEIAYGHVLLDNYLGRLPLEVLLKRDVKAVRLMTDGTWAIVKESYLPQLNTMHAFYVLSPNLSCMQSSWCYTIIPALSSTMSPTRSHLPKRSGRVVVVQLIPFNREVLLRILHASLKSGKKLSLLLTKDTTIQLGHSRQRRIVVLQSYIHVVDGLLGQTAVEVAASMSCCLTITEFPRGQKGFLSSEGVISFDTFGMVVGELLPRLEWF